MRNTATPPISTQTPTTPYKSAVKQKPGTYHQNKKLPGLYLPTNYNPASKKIAKQAYQSTLTQIQQEIDTNLNGSKTDHQYEQDTVALCLGTLQNPHLSNIERTYFWESENFDTTAIAITLLRTGIPWKPDPLKLLTQRINKELHLSTHARQQALINILLEYPNWGPENCHLFNELDHRSLKLAIKNTILISEDLKTMAGLLQ